MMLNRTCGAIVVALCCAGTAAVAQNDKLQGTTYRSPSGTTLRLMLDDSNVGAEVTMGEIVFPPNQDSGDHTHGAIEMFYVVSGELDHIVNGVSQVLKPGMAGFVKPPDKVRHKTGPAGAKAVVVWVPGRGGSSSGVEVDQRTVAPGDPAVIRSDRRLPTGMERSNLIK